MSINQTEAMQILITVAETGGFSSAAKKLRMQQSSVSRVVSALEDSLGISLLTRTTRKLSFTENGLKYLSESRRILSEIENLNQALRKTKETPQGSLKISLSTAFGKWVVMPKLAQFKAKFPNITLEVHLEDRFVDIVSEAYDVVIRVGESDDSRVTSRKIAVVRRGLFVSKKLHRKLGKITSPLDLERFPLVSFDDRVDSNTSWILTQGKFRHKIKFQSVTSVNQLEGVYQLVRDGLGIAQLPLFIGLEEKSLDAIEHVLPEWDVAGDVGSLDRAYALFIGGEKMSAKVRVFLDFLVSYLASGKPNQ